MLENHEMFSSRVSEDACSINAIFQHTTHYNTLQRNATQHNTTQCDTAQHDPIRSGTIQYNTVQALPAVNIPPCRILKKIKSSTYSCIKVLN